VSGLYIYKLTAVNFSQKNKLMLIRQFVWRNLEGKKQRPSRFDKIPQTFKVTKFLDLEGYIHEYNPHGFMKLVLMPHHL